MKKVFIGILVGVLILIFVSGACGAGLLIGRTISRNQNPAVSEVVVGPEQDVSDDSNLEAPEIFTPEDSATPEMDTAAETEQDTTPSETAESITMDHQNLDELFIPFWEAWEIVHEYFVDQPLDNQVLIQGAIDGMVEVIGSDTTDPDTEVTIPSASETGTPKDLETDFIPFWETWAHANNVDEQLLLQGAIRGLMDALGDQHSSYMDPDQFIQANIPIDGDYEGIGAWVDTTSEYLTIVSPMDGSPAEKAGLMPGDEIIAIDGDDMTGIDGSLVIRRVLGPAGTDVTLTIRREGIDDPFDVIVTRAQITIETVEHEVLENNIGYLSLTSFGEDSSDDLRNALEELVDQGVDGIVFDLRSNSGGLVNSAIEVASEFIGDGVLFYEDYGDDDPDAFNALRGGVATDIPLVVLINQGSASASEIVAGAIQDHDRAPLVGTTSFGKGSVQNWIPLSNNQGAVRVTIARWYTPDQRAIHEIGLEPDYPIYVFAQEDIDEGLIDLAEIDADPEDIVTLTAEEIQDGVDPQLDKAIQILLTQINE